MWPGYRLPQAVAIAEYGAVAPGQLHGARGANGVSEWMSCWFQKNGMLCFRGWLLSGQLLSCVVPDVCRRCGFRVASLRAERCISVLLVVLLCWLSAAGIAPCLSCAFADVCVTFRCVLSVRILWDEWPHSAQRSGVEIMQGGWVSVVRPVLQQCVSAVQIVRRGYDRNQCRLSAQILLPERGENAPSACRSCADRATRRGLLGLSCRCVPGASRMHPR